ncbi:MULTISPECIES: MerR family transcriptional regulator [Microvirgula]|uniref:MerR family DNA-binding transcriptional regulator n=1 Tax=Microvirgula aerodenitrificans TaxID=57480 RepID=A0A2S0P994_9NEIS|nr:MULTISPECIES: MerR family DNA-binding transcriptional regulator [Microvirgula]AVY93984.1 MerR family DNA-binding transcriptional regulator [Microvirgula aerodenitrificans]RAS11738.1 DNA-binding transcriptional MerR regulator [Microvirgula sp. AG722]
MSGNDKTYTISELAREFDVTTRTIRHYEEQGLIAPERRGQHRIYSRRDRIRLLLTLRGKRIGLTLNEVRELFELYDAARDDAPQLLEFMRILDLREQRLMQQIEDINVVMREVQGLKAQCERLLEKKSADADSPQP